MRPTIGLIAAAAFLASMPLVSCGSSEPESVTEETGDAAPTTLAAAIPADSRFAEALEAAGLATLFDGPEPYTVLLPPDEAFPETLPEDSEELAAILTQHILPGTILAEDLTAALERSQDEAIELATYGGETLTVRGDAEGLTIGVGGSQTALRPGSDELDNGALHRVDAILAP